MPQDTFYAERLRLQVVQNGAIVSGEATTNSTASNIFRYRNTVLDQAARRTNLSGQGMPNHPIYLYMAPRWNRYIVETVWTNSCTLFRLSRGFAERH